MKIIFFGSSDFSVSALEASLRSGHTVELVITTPDQKRGRGLKESPTPVRLFCEQRGLSVAAPGRLADPALLSKIQAMKPDVFVVSSYGKLIPPSWLGVPSVARLNVHPSLLPKYRGAAPINWAILNGDPKTGVSIIDITDELDAGDIYHQISVPLDPHIDAETLSEQLAGLSAEVLTEVLPLAEAGQLIRTPQDHAQAIYARKLEKSDGLIHWGKSASQIHNLVRGLRPWPTAFFEFRQGMTVQVLKSRVMDPSGLSAAAGEIVRIERDGLLHVQTGEGVIGLEVLKPAGKKPMSGACFANGWRFQTGARLERK